MSANHHRESAPSPPTPSRLHPHQSQAHLQTSSSSASSKESSNSSVGHHPPAASAAAPGLEGYLGELARQVNLRKLLDAYRLLAPVCIGGPTSTNLENHLVPHSATAAAATASAGQDQLSGLPNSHPQGHPGQSMLTANGMTAGYLAAAAAAAASNSSSSSSASASQAPPQHSQQQQQQDPRHHVHAQLGMLPRVDFANKLNTVLHPAAAAAAAGLVDPAAAKAFHNAAAAQAAAAAAAAHVARARHPEYLRPQPHGHGHGHGHGHSQPQQHGYSAADAAAQLAAAHAQQQQARIHEQNRLYAHLYSRMRVAQQQQQQQHVASPEAAPAEAGRLGPSPGGAAFSPLAPRRTLIKRRQNSRTSKAHLSGEVIRKLMAKQKMKAQALADVATKADGSSSRAGCSASAAASAAASPPALQALQAAGGPRQLHPALARYRRLSAAGAGGEAGGDPGSPPGPGGEEQRPRQQPVLLRRDLSHSGIEEAILNGESIPAFNIGGELRLCLPHVLRRTLSGFHYDQISEACEELQIHCAPCSARQLLVLKSAGVLPPQADQCGLITKSDAERLTGFLMLQQQAGLSTSRSDPSEHPSLHFYPSHASARSSPSKPTSPAVNGAKLEKDESSSSSSPAEEAPAPATSSAASSSPAAAVSLAKAIHVQHECFGQAQGWLCVEDACEGKCIKCKECNEVLEPQEFILHVHTSGRENRTCHWGFEPTHWRTYLHLDEDAYENQSQQALREAAEALDEFKEKFTSGCRANKRKKSDSESTPGPQPHSQGPSPALKRPKLEEASHQLGDVSFRPWRHHLAHVEESDARFIKEQADEDSSSDQMKNAIESPTSFVSEVKASLCDESSLSEVNKSSVFDTLERLSDRLREAETSRQVAVTQLHQLQRNYQALEQELIKKRAELLELMHLSKSRPKSNDNSSSSIVYSSKTDNNDEGSNNNNNNNNNDEESGQALQQNEGGSNLELEMPRRTHSVDSILSKDSEDLRSRMMSMESELRTLREEFALRNSLGSTPVAQSLSEEEDASSAPAAEEGHKAPEEPEEEEEENPDQRKQEEEHKENKNKKD